MSRWLSTAAVVLGSLLSGCGPRYEQVDGRWAWVTNDEGFGRRVWQLDADDATFEVVRTSDGREISTVRSLTTMRDPSPVATRRSRAVTPRTTGSCSDRPVEKAQAPAGSGGSGARAPSPSRDPAASGPR